MEAEESEKDKDLSWQLQPRPGQEVIPGIPSREFEGMPQALAQAQDLVHQCCNPCKAAVGRGRLMGGAIRRVSELRVGWELAAQAGVQAHLVVGLVEVLEVGEGKAGVVKILTGEVASDLQALVALHLLLMALELVTTSLGASTRNGLGCHLAQAGTLAPPAHGAAPGLQRWEAEVLRPGLVLALALVRGTGSLGAFLLTYSSRCLSWLLPAATMVLVPAAAVAWRMLLTMRRLSH